MTISLVLPKLSLVAEPALSSFRLQYLIEPFEGPIVAQTLTVSHELVIGRGPWVDVRLQGRLISRRHILVRAAYSGLELEDTSTYGTLVDGVPLKLASMRIGRECNLMVGCVHIWLRRVLHEEHS